MLAVIGALVLTYFASRALRLIGLGPPSIAKLVAGHLLSFVVLSLIAALLRFPTDTFRFDQLFVYLIAQIAWLLLDFYRAQIAFWKPPVTPAKESSSTRRAGNSR